MNSHIRVLKQHNDRILDHAPVSAAKRWGLKSKPLKEKKALKNYQFFVLILRV